jgi:DNA adenine methylase
MATDIISYNGFEQRHYVEPYSGGCGLALSLLFSGHVSAIHLNDLDRSVWAFWWAILNECDELIRRVQNVDINVIEWDRQRAVQADKATADPIDLGFSTFFLNRTNRSGIIHSGGVIGGRAQAGPWLIDCRFNRSDLIRRIRRVYLYRGKISIYNEDAEQFVSRVGAGIPPTALMYIDPPYYEKGSLLYKNSYLRRDHEKLAKTFSQLRCPWFLTYDNVDPIKELYRQYQSVELDIGYSVHSKRRGSELLVFSDLITPPPALFEEAKAA